MNTHKLRYTIKELSQNLSSYLKYFTPEKLNLLLSITTIILATYAFTVGTTQRQLKALIEIQSAKIGELAKINKDLHVSQKNKALSDSSNISTLNTLVLELTKIKEDQKQQSALDLIGDSSVLSAIDSVSTGAANYKGIVITKDGQPAPIFSQPSTTSAVIGTAKQNILFFFDAVQNNWYQVELNGGQKGWIQKNYLQPLPKG